MAHVSTAYASRTQRGFSLIDIMVGLIIGMIAVLVIYQVFAASEGIKRNTTSVGDAQQNGLLSSFMMTVEIANAANGLAAAQQDLMTCAPAASVAAFATSWRPIPLLITDGGGTPTNPLPDQFIVTYSTANRIILPAPFTANAPASNPTYTVQSPQGFQQNDLIVAIAKDGSGHCAVSRITGAVPAPDALGQVVIPQTGAPFAFTEASTLFNMGPSTTAQRALYDVASEVLRGTSLLDANGAPDAGAVPNPIASNIVMMKLQYGIDANGDGLLDTWVSATGPWADVALLAAPATTLNQIKAIRIGIVAKGEQYDKDLAAQDTANGQRTWKLFDNTITGPIELGFRYRTYEMVVPVLNTIWNS
jgi:type IV pilus assembly protein PilW